MSNPQLENGYTRIANEILDALAITDLNGSQRRIIDVLIRQTYGYQRKSHKLSISFISKATRLNNRQIQRELTKLIERKIISIISKATFNESRELQLNKDYKSWLNSTEVAKKTPVDGLDKHTGSGLDVGTGSGLDTQRKKERKYKETTNYKLVYDYYLSLGLIKHREYTNDISKAIKKAITDNKYDIEFCKVLLDRHKEVVELTKNSKYPVRVRGLAEFFGQKAFKATHLICSEYEEGGKLYEEHLNKNNANNVRVGVPPSESVLGKREVPWM